MASIMEMSLMCRLCLAKDKNQVNIPIFEDPGDIRQIFVKISSCLPIKISRDDQLPKNICDGCGDKLELLYEFWNTSLDSEKTLTAWLKQVKDPAVSAVTQQISKPAETLVKEETDAAEASTYLEPAQESSINEEAEIEEVEPEEPPKKRARRTAAVKAQINIAPESDDEDDNFDNNMDEPDSVDADVIAKLEGESEESDGDEKDPSFADLPGTSTQDQPGTSGLGKDGAEAPDNLDDIWTEPRECTLCNNFFSSNFALLKHKISCDPTGLYQRCATCKKYIRKEKYERHIVWHKVKRKKAIHACTACDKTFTSLQYLKLHVEKVHENKGVLYPCDVCGKNFSTKYRADYHKKTIHLKEFNMHCDQCGRGFLYLTELAMHVRKVHDKEIRVFSCPIDACRRNFRSNAALKYHTQTEHVENKAKHVCELCNKSFHHVSLYKRHLNRHTDLRRFSCNICGNQYTTKNSLEVHLRSHTGERPFVCELCGNSFTAGKFLKVHMVVHSKEKPYACLYCDKSFTQKGSLNIHVKKDHSL